MADFAKNSDAGPSVKIIDANWNPLKANAVGGFGGAFGQWNAASAKFGMDQWWPWPGSADSDNMWDSAPARSRARDLERNAPLARGALDSITNSVNGIGLKPSPIPAYRRLGKSKDWAHEWAIGVRDQMIEIFESRDLDVTGSDDLGGLGGMTLRNMLSSGAVGISFYWIEDGPRRQICTAVRLVESDRICNPNKTMDRILENGNMLRGGVEINDLGEQVAYHVCRIHPGDPLAFQSANYVWDRIERYTPWGRPNFVLFFDKERIDQNYGMSALATPTPEFKNLDDYKKAELIAAKGNALTAMTFESPMPFEALASMFGESGPEGYMKARSRWNSALSKGMSPGSIVPLFPGDKLSSFLPSRPNEKAIEFVRLMGRNIATSLGYPLESIDHNWAGLNYSAARTVILDANRKFNVVRHNLGREVYQVIYEAVFEELVWRGDIPDCDEDSFYENRAAWTRCKWIGNGIGWVDEDKEVTAAEKRIGVGISTLQDECERQGKDWRDLADQRAVEKAYYKSLGLAYPGDLAPPGVRMIDTPKADAGAGDPDEEDSGK